MAGVLLVLLCLPFINAATKLETFTVNPSEISVSGISSGGAMAVQFHVAYSGSVKGVGSIAGVPYSCSGGQLGTALGSCMNTPSGINVGSLESHAISRATAGKIDPVDNLQHAPVFVWAGNRDTVVNTGVSHKIETFYKDFKSNVKAVYDNNAEHTFPTENYGGPCSSLGSPYLGRCSYNGAYELLNFIHGNLTRPFGSVAKSDKFIEFDQSEFLKTSGRKRFLIDSFVSTELKAYSAMNNVMGSMLNGMATATSSIWDWWKKFLPGSGGSLPTLPNLPGLGGSLPGMSTGGSSGMDSLAYAYIPSGCYDSTVVCKLHIAFHGCKMGRETIGDVFAKHAGYNDVGEMNNIIIVYPQIKADTISNPNGCWDWWAYSGASYDSKDGVQMAAVKKMIDRVTGQN